MQFQYMNELKLFLQLFLLGAILCAIVMYITEAVKKWVKDIPFFAAHTKLISVVCFVLSMGFGFTWKMTFAAETVGWMQAAWLGLFLFLGSTGLYTKLENSEGFWGKTVQSFSSLIDTDKLFEVIAEQAEDDLGKQ